MDKMKRMAALLLAVFLLLPHLPVTTLAADGDVVEGEMGTEDSIFGIVEQGSCGDDLEWVFYDDGILLIRGTGDMWDYTADQPAPWAEHKDSITKLVLREGITSIGDYAFYRCGELMEINLPDGLISVGASAFFGCAQLQELKLPETLEEIGTYALAWCTGLTGELVVSGQISNIPEGAFTGLTGITSLYIGESVLQIHTPDNLTNAFGSMTSVQTVTFEGLLIPVLFDPFYEMPALETVYVPAEAYDVYERHFTGFLPEGVALKAIGDEETEGDDVIVYPPEFQVEDGVLIAYTGSAGEVNVPYGITAIGDLAFYCNRRIMKISLPSTVERINRDAFAACYSLQEISLPEGLTYIGNNAFNSCTALTAIDLPSSLTYIGNYAFFDCGNMAGELAIPDSVTTIGASAFSGCKKITEVTLPKALTCIDEFTFNGCIALAEIDLPDTITTIGYCAFAGCSSLPAIDLPESLTTLDNYAFQNCTAATGEVVIPDGVEFIPMGAFSGDSGIESLVIGAGVELIYSGQNNAHAFYDLNAVTEVTFTGLTVPNNSPNSSEYNKDLFTYMPNLKTVYVPAAAYANYEDAYGEHLPAGVELVAVGAAQPDVKPMQGTCGDDLTWVLDDDGTLTITGSGDMWDFSYGDEPLWMTYADRITGLVLEEGITSVGNQAFPNLSGLQEVHIPVDVTDIGEYAFFSCGNLTELYFYDETPPTIGDSAFRLTGLTTVYVPATRYTLYKNELKPHLPEGVVFKALGAVKPEPEPNPLTCEITGTGAVLSGEDLGHYMSKNALLLMAAYDGDGRMVGVSDTVSQVVGGTYRMTIEAEGIAKVQLFVMDWGNTPLKEAYIFE